MNKYYRQEMSMLLGLTLLPAGLVVSLFLGQETVSSGLINGTIAYAWMVTALYTSSKPAWLTSLVTERALGRLQLSLFIASLPLIWNHQLTSAGNSLLALTGSWAMVTLGAGLIYNGLLALAKTATTLPVNPTMSRWAKHLNALAVAIAFAHAQVFASSTNPVFMGLLYGVTGLAFYSYFKQLATQKKSITRPATKSSI